MKRFAAHYLLLPEVGFIRQQVVEIADDGRVRYIFPLTEEIESAGMDARTDRIVP